MTNRNPISGVEVKARRGGSAATDPGIVEPEFGLVPPIRRDKNGQPDEELDHELGWKIVALANNWRMRLDQELLHTGQNQSRWRALIWISTFDGKATQQEIADAIGIKSSTFARTLDGLVGQGLVRRCPAADDGRANTVEITDDARDILREIWDVNDRVRTEILAGVKPYEKQFCVAILDRMLANMGIG